MKQLIQNIQNGETTIIECPAPKLPHDGLVVATTRSLISVGTERMLVEFGKGSYLSKALQQPEKVKQTIEKAKTDGVLATFDAVRSKLGQPIPMGYCNVGRVLESSDHRFAVGDRVVSNGSHAEVVAVGGNLSAKIPSSVTDDEAAFTVLGSISLQAVRLIKPNIGDTCVVFGLGVLGLLAIQILKANGCNVIAIDVSSERCELAREFGVNAIVDEGERSLIGTIDHITNGRGVDSVIIAASANDHSIIKNAAKISRKRGKIVLLGVVGLNLDRSDFYEKEISFQVSCSYGPGRYDPIYEDSKFDYPYPYVRWTAQRNFEAFLGLLEKKLVNVNPLITQRTQLDSAVSIYNNLDKPHLGIIIEYSKSDQKVREKTINLSNDFMHHSYCNIGFLGSGNYASRTLLPFFKRSECQIKAIAGNRGLSASTFALKYSVPLVTTDISAIIEDPDINTVVIATPHQLHAEQVCLALNAGKNVFVEKPLALTLEEVERVKLAHANSKKLLAVGFNRRFSPLVNRLKKYIDKSTKPKKYILEMNAGYIPNDHWTQRIELGGGRIIGEACHYIDLLHYLTGSEVTDFNAMSMANTQNTDVPDNVTITLSFSDGSLATIHYFANGGKSLSKEKLSVHFDGRSAIIENFKSLKFYNSPGTKDVRLFKQDKGQKLCIEKFVDCIKRGKDSFIPSDQLYSVANLSIQISNQLVIDK